MKKFALNLHLPTVQILTNDDKMFILCLSYFITTVFLSNFQSVIKHLPLINWVYSVHHYSIWKIFTLCNTMQKVFLLMIGQSLSYEAWMVEMVKWMVAALLVVFSNRGLTWIHFWGCVHNLWNKNVICVTYKIFM